MHDSPNGTRHPWPTPSPADMILDRIDRLGSQAARIEGRLEMGFDMTTHALTEGFRKADHAHGRITALTGRVEHLERFASTTTAGTGATPTSRTDSLLSLAGLKALSAALPELREVILAVVVLLGVLGWVKSSPIGSTTSPAAPPASVSPSAP
jgi:hypothetical protein